MAINEVYSQMIAPNQESPVPSKALDPVQVVVKLSEMMLSLAATALVASVPTCSCKGAYVLFLFICSFALFLTMLFFIFFGTSLHTWWGAGYWPVLNMVYTSSSAMLFVLASTVFVIDNRSSTIEKATVAFGFLAGAIFSVDVGLILKKHVCLWKPNVTPESNHGGPLEEGGPPEEEKLNTPLQAYSV